MELQHFGLTARPFAHGPDPAAYFPAASHEEARDEIAFAIHDDEPVVLVTGDTGVGKTLVAHLATAGLGDVAIVAFVPNCLCETRADLLQSVLYELGQPYSGLGEQELRLNLTDFALSHHREGRRVVIVLDEAQLLPSALFEEIRIWTNLESPRGKAVQVVLVGQPSLLSTLDRPGLASFAQRICTRVRVDGWGVRESAEYISHQLRRVGGVPDKIIVDEARTVLAKSAGGVPRVLNQAARASLSFAAKAGFRCVDVEVVFEALAGLPQVTLPEHEEEPVPAVFSIDSIHDVPMTGDEPELSDLEPWSADESAGPHKYVFTPATH